MEPSWAQPGAARPKFPFVEHHCSTTAPKYFRSMSWVQCSEIIIKKSLYNLFNLLLIYEQVSYSPAKLFFTKKKKRLETLLKKY